MADNSDTVCGMGRQCGFHSVQNGICSACVRSEEATMSEDRRIESGEQLRIETVEEEIRVGEVGKADTQSERQDCTRFRRKYDIQLR